MPTIIDGVHPRVRKQLWEPVGKDVKFPCDCLGHAHCDKCCIGKNGANHEVPFKLFCTIAGDICPSTMTNSIQFISPLTLNHYPIMEVVRVYPYSLEFTNKFLYRNRLMEYDKPNSKSDLMVMT